MAAHRAGVLLRLGCHPHFFRATNKTTYGTHSDPRRAHAAGRGVAVSSLEVPRSCFMATVHNSKPGDVLLPYTAAATKLAGLWQM